MAESHLATLELDHTATRDDVKRAYRTLVRVWHPDRFSSDTSLQEVATKKLARINEANAWLRANWDTWVAGRNSSQSHPTCILAPAGEVTKFKKTDGSEGERRMICGRVLQVDWVRL